MILTREIKSALASVEQAAWTRSTSAVAAAAHNLRDVLEDEGHPEYETELLLAAAVLEAEPLWGTRAAMICVAAVERVAAGVVELAKGYRRHVATMA